MTDGKRQRDKGRTGRADLYWQAALPQVVRLLSPKPSPHPKKPVQTRTQNDKWASNIFFSFHMKKPCSPCFSVVPDYHFFEASWQQHRELNISIKWEPGRMGWCFSAALCVSLWSHLKFMVTVCQPQESTLWGAVLMWIWCPNSQSFMEQQKETLNNIMCLIWVWYCLLLNIHSVCEPEASLAFQ